MEKLFLTQLIASFFVGGIFIAVLAFIAERANPKIAGVILALPSTMAVGYFFIGLTLSPLAVKEIFSVLTVNTGINLVLISVYLYFAQFQLKKINSIILSTGIYVGIWLLVSIPLAIFKFSNALYAVLIYGVLLISAHYLLAVRNKIGPPQSLLTYTKYQKLGRAVFAGLIIVLAVLLAKVLGPFWGGIFSAFPAAFLSTLIILHWYYNGQFLFRIVRGIPLGSPAFVIYAAVASYAFPAFGVWIGTVLSYAASLVFFLIVIKLKNT